MNTTHAKAIKGMSIANIVLAALSIFGCLIACAGLGVGGYAVTGSGYNYVYTDDGIVVTTGDVAGILGFLGIFVFLGVICFIFVLVAGIMGVRGSNKPEKLKSVMVWNIVGAVASFFTGGLVTLVLCIVVAVFANKDKQALAYGTPYGAQPYGAPVQPQAPVAPQQPVAAVAAVPVAAAVAAEAVAGTGVPATPATAPATEVAAIEETLVSDPAPVTPAADVAAEAVTATEVAAVEPAVVLPDNYIEDAQAGVTIIEETSTEDEQK